MDPLIARALARFNAGRGGRRTLLRLQNAGLDSGELAQSGVDGGAPVNDALDARRQSNALRAVIRARAALDSGQEVGAATQARLNEGGVNQLDLLRLMNPQQRDTATSTSLEQLRKLRARTHSNAKGYAY